MAEEIQVSISDETIKTVSVNADIATAYINEGYSGTSGTSGTSGNTGASGTSGTSGDAGTSGTSGIDGTSGAAGVWTGSLDGSISRNSNVNITGSLIVSTSSGNLKVENYGINGYTRLYSDNTLIIGKTYKALPSLILYGNTIDMEGSNYVYMPTQVWANVATLGKVGNNIQFDLASTASSYGVKGILGQLNDTFYVNDSNNAKLFSVGNSGSISIGKYSNNIHQVTGSLNVTGSVGINTTNLSQITTGFGASAQKDLIWIVDDEANKVPTIVVGGKFGGAIQITDENLTPRADFGFYSPDIYFVNRAGGDIKFRYNSTTDALTIKNDGNVGIGTITPNAKLHVVGNTTITGSLEVSGSTKIIGSAEQNAELFTIENTNGNALFRTIVGYEPLNLYAWNAKPASWLVIGADYHTKTNEVGRMDICATNGVFINSTLYPQGNVVLTRLGNATSVATQQGSYPVAFQGSLWSGSVAHASSIYIRNNASTTVEGLNRLAITLQSGSADLGVNNPERFSLLNNGNLGIGVINPSVRLEVSGSTKFGNSSTDTHQFTGSVDILSGSIIIKPVLTSPYFQYLKPDGTNLLYAMWDGGNFHHYLNGSMYWNLDGNAFRFVNGNVAMDKNGIDYSNPADWTTKGIRFGEVTYATAGAPLTKHQILFKTYGWNGATGYQTSSAFTISSEQVGAEVNNARFSISSGHTSVTEKLGISSNGLVSISGSMKIGSSDTTQHTITGSLFIRGTGVTAGQGGIKFDSATNNYNDVGPAIGNHGSQLLFAGGLILGGNNRTIAEINDSGGLSIGNATTSVRFISGVRPLIVSGSTKIGNSSTDTHQFTGSLEVSGSILLGQGTKTIPALSFTGQTTTGIYNTNNIIEFTSADTLMLRISNNGLFMLGNNQLSSDKIVGWYSGIAGGGGSDVGIGRNAAGELKITDGSTGLGKLKVGDTQITGSLEVSGSVDIASGSSMILTSANGTKFKIEVDNTGALITTSI